jgi:Fe2+ transport system protein FeoA
MAHAVPNSSEVEAGASLPLPKLPVKSPGRVRRLDADDDDATRLKALGVCVGRQVELVKAGDPLIVRVLGARIGLSARLAAQVQVELL